MVKLVRYNEVDVERRPDGREVRQLISHAFDKPVDSITLYHCTVPKGRFSEHYHSESDEIIMFPLGGRITVNDETFDMEPWDFVLLEAGDRHGFEGDDCPDIIHLAIKVPDRDDKVSTK